MPRTPSKAKPAPAAAGIRFGDRVLPVSDPHGVQTVCADVITEWRTYDNLIGIGFGTILIHPVGGGGAEPEVVICSRLRMTHATAIDLRNTLDTLLKPPVPKGEAH